MKKVIILLLCIIIFIFTGCVKNMSGDEKTAEDFIKSQGYKISSRLGEIQKYVLEKSKLTENGGLMQVWSVQKVAPEKYFGKEIVVYGFIVKNHPLQERDKNAKSGVRLYIMLVDGKVIGGYSNPAVDVAGWVSSLEGKTLEEVTGQSYTQWAEDWKTKYSSSN